MLGEHPGLDLQEVGALAGPLAEDVMAAAAEVPVLAGDPRAGGGTGCSAARRIRKSQSSKNGSDGIERTGLGEQRALDQQGVERDVVVDQQDVRIEVAAVGEAALAADPAPPRRRARRRPPPRRCRRRAPRPPRPGRRGSPGARERRGRRRPGRSTKSPVAAAIPASAAAARPRFSARSTRTTGSGKPAGTAGGSPPSLTSTTSARRYSPAARLASASASRRGRSRVRTIDRDPRPLADLVDLRQAAEMADELRRAAGGEILDAEAAVPLGQLDARRQAQGAEPAQPERRVPVGVPLLLAGVGRHRPLQPLALGADVHQQIGIAGVVDLVEEDAQARGAAPVPDGRRARGASSRWRAAKAARWSRETSSGEGTSTSSGRWVRIARRIPSAAASRWCSRAPSGRSR